MFRLKILGFVRYDATTTTTSKILTEVFGVDRSLHIKTRVDKWLVIIWTLIYSKHRT